MRSAFLYLVTVAAVARSDDAEDAVVFLQRQQQLGEHASSDSAADKCSCSGLGAKSLLFQDLIGIYGDKVPPQQFCKCALVGSSQTLKGKGLGKLIDSHDTVIRVNRLPLQQHFEDFGSKTDIYFAEPGWGFGRPHYEKTVNFWADDDGGRFTIQSFQNDLDGQQARSNCSLKVGGEDCQRFGTLIMKGSDAVRFKKKGQPFQQRFPLNQPGWQPGETAFPVGFQQNGINTAVFDVLDSRQPSNGFHAFLTFAPLCGSISLYGFEGETTYDDHEMNHVHKLEKEHSIYDKLAAGEITNIDLKGYPPAVQLQSLAARGCIKKVDSAQAAEALKLEEAAEKSADSSVEKKVCFFVRTSVQEGGNDKLRSVTATWAYSTEADSHLFYMVDQDAPPYKIPSRIKPWQVIPTPRMPYKDLPFRDSFMIQKLNSPHLLEQCKWMALLDDDVYVNRALVIEQLRWLDPKVPRIITAAVDNSSLTPSFAHSCFRLFSEAAVPIVAGALEKCSKAWRNANEADAIACLQKLNLNKDVQLQRINANHSVIHAVDRDDIEQQESVFTAIGQDLALKRCNSAMVVHKLLPRHMIIYHAMISGVSICTADLDPVEY